MGLIDARNSISVGADGLTIPLLLMAPPPVGWACKTASASPRDTRLPLVAATAGAAVAAAAASAIPPASSAHDICRFMNPPRPPPSGRAVGLLLSRFCGMGPGGDPQVAWPAVTQGRGRITPSGQLRRPG